MNSITIEKFDFDDFGVRIYSKEEVSDRILRLGVVAGTNLLPENLIAASQVDSLRGQVAAHFRSSSAIQHAALLECVGNPRAMSAQLESAFSSVNRREMLGLSDDPLAYWNGVNVVRGSNGCPSPWLVRHMLEALRIESGALVSVLGYGTGYTTHIASALVGGLGTVFAVDIDPELCASARTHLQQLSVTNAHVLKQDALQLVLPRRVDAICATLSVAEIPISWIESLNEGGTIGCFVPTFKNGEPLSLICNLEYQVWKLTASGLKCISSMSGLINASFESGMVADGSLDVCINEHTALTELLSLGRNE